MASKQQKFFVALGIFSLAFGWIEASTVVYLREIYLEAASLGDVRSFSSLPMTVIALPGRVVAIEMMREGCTIVLLGAVALLAGGRRAERAGAFLLLFGIWDLTYYAALRVLSGWPDSFKAWDILFLIPVPWVAPVWAPAVVAAFFVAAGNHLFWTAERERHYGWRDITVLVASVALTMASFLAESASAINRSEPERFPIGLYAAGVMLGILWFVRVERRTAADNRGRRPWLGVRVQTILPPSSEATQGNSASRGPSIEPDRVRAEDVATEYESATSRLDALLREAGDLGERLERVARGLSAHPEGVNLGNQLLPSTEHLALLVNEIRSVNETVEDLRDRLVLMGRADLVQRRDTFYQ